MNKDYLFLKLRKSINKDLYDEKIIDFDLFNKMQNKIEKKMRSYEHS